MRMRIFKLTHFFPFALWIWSAYSSQFQLEFPPSITSVIINIGCNIDPPMPPADNQSVAVIAVEPVLQTAVRIPFHERLYVITCAIADVPRFQTMHLYNVGGLSSSLASSKGNPWWKQYTDIDPRIPRIYRSEEFKEARRKPQHAFQIVPVMPLKMLIHAIPARIFIQHLKTDMQGFDFVAIKSAGKALQRIRNLVTEVHLSEPEYDLGNTTNYLERDWKPYMTSLGYKLDHVQASGKEGDAHWVLV